jgi:16S rRNA (uracil1498-N3)-methyltransferase
VFVFLKDLSPGQHTLTRSQAAHLWSLRVKHGDVLLATNLQGILGKIQITNINKVKQTVDYQVLENQTKPSFKTQTIYQAQIDKLYLEKLVEILPLARVTNLVIFRSQNSPKQKLNLERLDKILIRSCEQSETVWKPEIVIADMTLEEILKNQKPLVLERVKGSNIEEKSGFDSVLVGPEGGWSDSENKLFKSLNSTTHSLGKVNLPAWIAGYTYFCR